MKDIVQTLRFLFRRLGPLMRPYRWLLVKGFVALLLSNIGLIAVSALIGQIARRVAQGGIGSLELASWLTGTMVLLFLTCVLKILMRVWIISASRFAERDLRSTLYTHLQRLSPSFYDRTRTGEIMSSLTNDIGAVREVLGPGILYPLNLFTLAPAALVVMLWLSPFLTFVTLLPTLLFPILVSFFSRKLHARFVKVQECLGRMSSEVQESLAGIQVLKSFALEDSKEAVFADQGREYMHENMGLVHLRSVFFPLLGAIGQMLTLLAFIAGGFGVYAGWIDMGDFVVFTLVQAHLLLPVIMVSWVVSVYERGRAGLSRVDKLLAAEAEIVGGGSGEEVPLGGTRLSIQGLDFSYDRGGRVLEGIDLEIPAGQWLGITGPVGGGKTSLIEAIRRSYPSPPGRIRIGGVAVEDLPLGQLRDLMRVVDQEPFIFSQSVADNIRFGHPGATEEALRLSARLAGLEGEVDEFEKGFETMVGEKGVTLSGGQKLRMALARALMKEAPILILDDAFSAVDLRTEEEIVSRLRCHLQGVTVLIVSHRVSTLMRMDRVITLQEGRVTQAGSHDELMDREGYYREIALMQRLEQRGRA
ncbi:MAG: ABC transporter ATP-binding protein [Planctomycetes bacterium]|nr:ABC transporter ATP-binding protein [Planctomycetota bacterium]